ncbi:MAG: ATP-binding protein [Bryobacteraceae bacterium]
MTSTKREHLARASIPSLAPPVEATSEFFDLSPELRTELLDPEGWGDVLNAYARTTKLAVALTDPEGRLSGACHNPKTIWRMAKQPTAPGGTCPFCLAPDEPCTAAADCLQGGSVIIARDQAGLAHVAVPLSLGKYKLGALIAGQVFDHYPEPLPLRRIARQFGIPAQPLWQEARKQLPVSRTTLRVYGQLLQSLGQAVMRQRYAVILDRKLKETNRRYELLIEGAKDYALFTVNNAGCVTSWNGGAERKFGYTEVEIVGQNFARFFTPDDVQTGVPSADLQKAIRSGWAQEQRWQIRRDGTRFFCLVSLTPLADGAEGELGGMIHDITERRNAEEALLQVQKLETVAVLERSVAERTQQLAETNIDLRRANEDLEQFAYSASHDLQEPLRNVTAYSELFRQMYEGKIDAQADEFLGYMINGAKRMEILVKDLLVYTQATLALGPAAAVDAKAILQRTLTGLGAAIRENDASITFEQLPTVKVQEVHLQQLFQNLIGNAIKYRKVEEAPLIQIAVERQGSDWLFSVKDNGIGIDPRYFTQIFGIFKRLHTAEKYSGTGIGLAICQKIVERYRGRIWVESVPGTGSTFRFTLPGAG